FLLNPGAFAPNGKLLAVRSYTQKREGTRSWWTDYKVRLYDLATRQQRHCLDNDGPFGPLAFSSDSKMLAAAGEKCIRLWDVATGRQLWHSPGLDTNVSSLDFSGNGRKLASGLGDTTVLVWDIARSAGKSGR